MDISLLNQVFGHYIPLFLAFAALYFQVYLILSFVENYFDKKSLVKSKIKSERVVDDMLPKISIIVPCFNEERTVAKTIRSLLGLDYPSSKLSIIVVDDGSIDRTYIEAMRFSDHSQVKIIRKDNGGKHTALNLGIEMSNNANFVGCLDADSEVHPQALRRMLPHFTQDVVAVTPAIIVSKPSTIVQRIQRAEYWIGIAAKRFYATCNGIHVTPGPLSIFRRELFSEIGLFRSAHNTEDMEIAFRIHAHGKKIANCANAHVYTVSPNTVYKLYRQRVRWIYGFIKNVLDYRHLLFSPSHGTLGMFTLPFAILSIVSAFYGLGFLMYHIGQEIYYWLENIYVTGIGWPTFDFSFFYISTESLAVLGLIISIIGMAMMLYGRYLSDTKPYPHIDMFYFVLLYIFISPFWLTKAILNVALDRKTPWR